MGKTKRFRPEGDELTQISHRVSRKDISRINREARKHILASIVIPPDNYVELPEQDVINEILLDKKMDVIQLAVEELVATAIKDWEAK